jgi:hypothetical protein
MPEVIALGGGFGRGAAIGLWHVVASNGWCPSPREPALSVGDDTP